MVGVNRRRFLKLLGWVPVVGVVGLVEAVSSAKPRTWHSTYMMDPITAKITPLSNDWDLPVSEYRISGLSELFKENRR